MGHSVFFLYDIGGFKEFHLLLSVYVMLELILMHFFLFYRG